MKNARAVLVLMLLAAPGTILVAQHDSTHHHPPADTAFLKMQERGKTAMNVDQNMATHRFSSLPDGGQIELTSNTDDTSAVNGIRRHIADIRKAFSTGDFSTPAFVHMQAVPGTSVMAAKAALIKYAVKAVARGARLRMITKDAEALAAIHEFMEFQRTEHHAGSGGYARGMQVPRIQGIVDTHLAGDVPLPVE